MCASIGFSQASQCLAVAARLDNQQGSIMCSVRDHAERARDLVAQQIGGVMESVGEALEVLHRPIHLAAFLLLPSSHHRTHSIPAFSLSFSSLPPPSHLCLLLLLLISAKVSAASSSRAETAPSDNSLALALFL